MDTAIADFEEAVEHEGYDNDAHLTEGRPSMGHVRNRSCGCEVNNMLHARSLHTKTKGSNSPYPPQTGGSKLDDSRTQRDERAVHQLLPRLPRPGLFGRTRREGGAEAADSLG